MLLAIFGNSPAGAHAFGARYDLPLPLELYLISAGVAVALSFVIMALVFDKRAVGIGIVDAQKERFITSRKKRFSVLRVVVEFLATEI